MRGHNAKSAYKCRRLPITEGGSKLSEKMKRKGSGGKTMDDSFEKWKSNDS